MATDDNIYSMRDDNRYVEETTEASPLLDNISRSLPTNSELASSSFHHDNDLTEIADESRYEEVAANISNRDDPRLPCFTFRSCILGLLFTCTFAFVNQFFTYRTVPIFLSMIVAQLLSHPIGKAMASILPRRTITLFGGKWRFSLNPGPFSVKEHCIISIMANTASVSIESAVVIAFSSSIFRVHQWRSKF